MSGINQQDYYVEAKKLIEDLLEMGNSLVEVGIDVEPLTKIMEKTYVDHVLPHELEEANKKDKTLDK